MILLFFGDEKRYANFREGPKLGCEARCVEFDDKRIDYAGIQWLAFHNRLLY